MLHQRTDGIIYATLVLAAAAAVLSCPADPIGHFRQVGSLVLLTEAISDTTLAAGALGDIRYLDEGLPLPDRAAD
jgi:hypothetical protein